MSASRVDLTLAELREVTAYAASCAGPALAIFERRRADDQRPRDALEATLAFARGARRTKSIRDAAWGAMRASQAARTGGDSAASEAARATLAAAGAPYLHPIARTTQVAHILGAAAHCARALELEAEGDKEVGSAAIERSREAATRGVIDVLSRYPPAPDGGGRVGELMRQLDASLRAS